MKDLRPGTKILSFPFKAIVPALIGLTLLASQNGIQKTSWSVFQTLKSGILHDQPNPTSNASAENEPGWLVDIGEALLASYSNYFAFMLMMFLVDVVIHGSSILRHTFAKQRNQKRNFFLQGSIEEGKQILISLLKSMIVYSFIFCFYQIMGMKMAALFDKGISLPTLSEDSSQSYFVEGSRGGIRILEGQSQSPFQDDHIKSHQKKPSLSIGKVLKEINFYARSIKLSKDEKTVFAVGGSPSVLKVINVSDPEYPIIVSSLTLTKNFYGEVFKTIALSPDETKIYISNFKELQIIDVSNFKSPIVIAAFEDQNFNEMILDYKTPDLCIPNLFVSKDNKFLFEAGYGLKIVDISIPTAPKVIYSVVSRVVERINYDRFISSSAALSSDEKTLYYSDGSFHVYNVEDLRNIKEVNSLNTTFLITSMMLLQDKKTVYVMGLDQHDKIILQKLEISDNYSIEKDQIIALNRSSRATPVFMSQTPNDLFLMIGFRDETKSSPINTLAFDTQEGQLVTHKKLLIEDEACCVIFTEDYKKVFVGSRDKLKIVELYLNFPNKNAFTESYNNIQSCDVWSGAYKTAFAPLNESLLYSLSQGDSKYTRRFGVHAVSKNFESFTNISSYDTGDLVEQMVFSQDNKKAYLVSKNTIKIVDISDPNKVALMGEYAEEEKDEDEIDTLELSRDGKIGYITHTYIGKSYLKIVDFSDPKNVIKKDSIEINKGSGYFKPLLSKDERTIFVISKFLSVYNVSDHSSITFLNNKTSLWGDYYYVTKNPQPTLSPDGKILFVKDLYGLSKSVIKMIDVSNVTSPRHLNELSFPYASLASSYEGKSFAFSADSRTIYFLQQSSLTAVDISDLNSPRYLGAIKIEIKSLREGIIDFRLSGDGRRAYVITKGGRFSVISIEPVHSTYMKEDILMLGERYSIDLQALEMDKYLYYNVMAANHRFAKFAIAEPSSLENLKLDEEIVLKMAPSWMNFDLNTRTLNVEARRKSDIGTYRLYFAFSTQLRYDAFYEIKGMNDYSNSNDLFACLVAQGYLDSEFYITQNFGKDTYFILPNQYNSIRMDVYSTLKKYYFETFNEVRIVQSLKLTKAADDTLKISTASLTNLKVEINLSEGGKFLTRYHGHLSPLITKNKSQLVIEGSLQDINFALEEVVVNLPENLTSCDGEIIIDDKLNPVMSESIMNISRYFNRNKPPGLNKDFSMSLQDQVDHELVYTGQYFQIKVNPKTFFDNYTEIENLNYHLLFVQDNIETTVLPSWLSFEDLTLMGTAPEVLIDREFEFKLVVKNEFLEHKEPLGISVRISSSFILKLLMKYSPYILSIVGLLISANKIFNVICKGTYKHPKEFHVRIGQEITDEVIFPISFVAEEKREAKTILKFLEKKIGNREKLLSYLAVQGERKLDKVKISGTIMETLNDLSPKEQEELDFYLDSQAPRRLLVDQIVFNMLVTEMMESIEERETRIYYEKIKKHWTQVVEWDLANSCFKIDNEKVLLEGEKYDEKETKISTSLIDKSNVNLELLKDAILAYAFECQNIDTMPVFIQFKVKEKIKTNFLKRFLKLDLQDCPFSEKGKIGYGIKYDREFNTLCFSGTARRDIQGKTLVFQITDLRQRILRELWIFGKGTGNETFSLRKSLNETDGMGKEYQIL